MREIKFRGLRVDGGGWVYGSLIDKQRLRKGLVLISEWVEHGEGYYIEREVVPESVGQYTGLKDKHGKEIYEEDRVKITRINWHCFGHPNHGKDVVDEVEVYWDEERNAISTRTFDFERLKQNPNQPPYSSSGYLGNGWEDYRADEVVWEIIGNIHEVEND